MHVSKNIYRNLIVGLLFGGLVAAGAIWYSAEQLEDAAHAIELKIIEQETLLYELADRIGRNEGDAVVNRIITDCSVRREFDDLLNNLATLSAGQLQTLEQYYDGCAPFYSERKAITMTRFEREFAVYEDYVQLLAALKPGSDTERQLTVWEELIALEGERTTGLQDRVRIQRDIIEALLANLTIGSAEIQELVSEAQAVSERLSVVGIQINQKREQLSNL